MSEKRRQPRIGPREHAIGLRGQVKEGEHSEETATVRPGKREGTQEKETATVRPGKREGTQECFSPELRAGTS